VYLPKNTEERMPLPLTITLSDEEVKALNDMIASHRAFESRQCTLEDAIHECIRTALYQEGEISAQQEGM
jgi:predicted transcriptional regulator